MNRLMYRIIPADSATPWFTSKIVAMSIRARSEIMPAIW